MTGNDESKNISGPLADLAVSLQPANDALYRSSQRLLDIYEIKSNPMDSFAQLRRRLFIETVWYNDNLHPVIYRLIEKFSFISRTALESMAFSSPPLLDRLVYGCKEFYVPAERTRGLFAEVYTRLTGFEDEVNAKETQDGISRLAVFAKSVLKDVRRRKGLMDENILIFKEALKEYRQTLDSMHTVVRDIRKSVEKLEDISRLALRNMSSKNSDLRNMSTGRNQSLIDSLAFPLATPRDPRSPADGSLVEVHGRLTTWRRLGWDSQGLDRFYFVTNDLKQTIQCIKEKEAQYAESTEFAEATLIHNGRRSFIAFQNRSRPPPRRSRTLS